MGTLLTTPTPRALSLSSLIPAQHRHRPQVLVDQDLPRIPLFLLFPPLPFLSSFFFRFLSCPSRRNLEKDSKSEMVFLSSLQHLGVGGGGGFGATLVSRTWSALAAPALKKKVQAPAAAMEYVLYLDEESLSSSQTQTLLKTTTTKTTSKSKIPSMKEEVVFDFGAKFTCYMRKSAAEESALRNQRQTTKQRRSTDPFEGVPFRGLAEYLGGSYMQAMEASKEHSKGNKQQMQTNKSSSSSSDGQVPEGLPAVATLLPFTSAFAKTKAFKSTFVVDDDKSKRRTRLSWYNPNDGMVPRNWFRDGLVADLHWYKPFAED